MYLPFVLSRATWKKPPARWGAACGFAVILASQPAAAELAVEHLTTNGRENPLGIAADDLSFSWASVSQERGVVQQAYQIRVGTSAGAANVWDSGQMTSSRQVDVVLPPDIELSPATRYYWQVRVWDGDAQASEWSEPAWFETGMLAEGDWSGAEWIARQVGSPDIDEWDDYTATVRFTLTNEAFGVFLRCSADGRDAYMMQVNVTGGAPVFKPHKRVNGAYTLLDTINLSGFGHTNASLTGSTHILQFHVSGGSIVTKLDGDTIDTRSGVSFPKGFVGFRTFGSEAGAVERVQVVDEASGEIMIDRDFSAGVENGFSAGVVRDGALQISGDTDSIFANVPPSLPLLRGKFTARDDIASVRLYASALGLYEISVNGAKAGDQFLAPGWTDYERRIQAQTYDITNLVQPGENVIGVALADGWYRGAVGLGWTRVYGDQLAFVAKVKVTYDDGSSEWFATGPSWKASYGPYVQGDLQDGEVYHAGLKRSGWDTTAFDDTDWSSVVVVANASARLVPQPDEPVREVALLTAVSRVEIQPGTWIYDLGQNMVGVPRMVLSGEDGETATIRHAEELYRTGSRAGQIYTANLRSADATDIYTFATTGTVTYQPKFTQHGFRYIEISGLASPPAASDVHGVVLSSDLPSTGDLETSHEMLNQLVSNIRWGQRGNFLSIPTDTPARDERLGWTGDINVFSPTAARLGDTRAFLSKWMNDVRDVQRADGNLPAVVPQPDGQFNDTGVGWSDAVITIPYSVWKATGDERIVRGNWDVMKRFYAFVHHSATGDGDLLEQGRSTWFSGDWLSLESGWNRLEEHKVIATAYFAENTRMMSEMAEVMGEADLAQEWAALVPQIREAFVAAYRSGDGSIYQGTQTAYALALGWDMIADPEQRRQTGRKFVEKLASDGDHLRTGFLGTPWLLPALSKIGRDDLAMTLLLNEDYPSWGFPISMGATTMWERWNSIQPDGSFGPVDMNSFNHYAYGAVGDWMFGHIAGIRKMEVGYKTMRIDPLIGAGGLTNARCSQRTPFGRISVEWNVAESGNRLQLEIPANTTAEVHLPRSAGAGVSEGTGPAESAAGVQLLRTQGDTAVYAVDSGTYDFTWIPVLAAPASLDAVAETDRVNLTWAAVDGATGYRLLRSTVSGGPYTPIGGDLTSPGFSDSNVVKGRSYFYVVRAFNAATEGANSDEVSVQVALALNGGFEDPPTGGYVYQPVSGDWQFDSQSGVAADGSLFTDANPDAPEGMQVTFLQRTGTVRQTLIGLIPEMAYEVVFQAAQRAEGSAWNAVGQTWEVRLDESVLGAFGPDESGTAYAEYRLPFTATAGQHELVFAGTNLLGGDNTVFLDGVEVVPVVVPVGDKERRAPFAEWMPDGEAGPGLRLTVRDTVPGYEYVLQANADLQPEGWWSVSQPRIGDGGDMIFSAPSVAALRQFFRIMIWN